MSDMQDEEVPESKAMQTAREIVQVAQTLTLPIREYANLAVLKPDLVVSGYLKNLEMAYQIVKCSSGPEAE